MKYAVLIKQVPDVSQMQFDPQTRRLRREGVRLEVSSFDVRALLRALELRAATGGEVVVLTMGPPQAREALVHCLALGADRGVHLVDPVFAGSDTLATARALALALRREGFDLVLCGKSSVDAETGQVGPEVAELLDLPQVTAVRRLDLDARRGRVKAERETDAGSQTVECQLPALVSVTEDIAAERFPKRAEKEAAKGKSIAVLAARDLSAETGLFGVAGSPTRVEGLQSVEVKREGRLFEGDLADGVRSLVAALAERGIFRPHVRATAPGAGLGGERSKDPSRALWVVAEVLEGRLRRVSLELLGKAVALSAKSGGPVSAVLLGHGVRAHARELAAYGADSILVCDDPLLVDYSTDAYTAVLADAIRKRRPRSVLVPSTAFGRDFAPRIAARLGLGLTGDAIDLSLDEEGRLVQWKPAFGGNIVAPILSSTLPEIATVRPGMLEAITADPRRHPIVEELRITEAPAIRTLVTESRTTPGVERAAALDECEAAIGVGMGVGGVENLDQLEPLAAALGGAAIAATRDVADAGWLPRQHQVGLTGRAIAPRLYVAVGIRGAFEHMVGLRKAGPIVAINKSPKAPIFQQSDFGLVAEWSGAVPLLAQEIEAIRKART
ncbi:MAG TPA: FAD-binding protein [Candidatus Binatia bacterium]|nr:FAD-binding protein [Candidatus Binatia bacterium]